MDWIAEVTAAEARVRDHVRRTPIEFSHFLSEQCNAEVYLKLENFQRTGSFKLRGALNKLLVMDAGARCRGVVAASTGNHGAGVACGARTLQAPAIVFAPEQAEPSKLRAIRAYGAEIRHVGRDCLEAEQAAREFAREQGLEYLSPYNDAEVIAGQGTLGFELAQQLDSFDALFISVGGGGLISGVGGYLKSLGRDFDLIGCSPRHSAVMAASLQAGRILELESLPTLSDGTAGGVEADSMTFDLCRQWIDDFTLVEEPAIADGVRMMLEHQHMLVEGAAGTAVAALLQHAKSLRGRRAVVVLCGSNMAPEVLASILKQTSTTA